MFWKCPWILKEVAYDYHLDRVSLAIADLRTVTEAVCGGRNQHSKFSTVEVWGWGLGQQRKKRHGKICFLLNWLLLLYAKKMWVLRNAQWLKKTYLIYYLLSKSLISKNSYSQRKCVTVWRVGQRAQAYQGQYVERTGQSNCEFPPRKWRSHMGTLLCRDRQKGK